VKTASQVTVTRAVILTATTKIVLTAPLNQAMKAAKAVPFSSPQTRIGSGWPVYNLPNAGKRTVIPH
jgi:hypothetical protein